MSRLLLAFALALGLALVPSASLAAVVSNVTFPLNEQQVNPCNGDSITFTGTGHDVITTTVDGSGGYHFTEALNVANMKGVSSDGTIYHGGGGNHFESYVAASSLPAQKTLTSVFLLISNGPAPNLTVTVTLHVTINPDGTVTSSVGRIDSACRG